MKKVIKILKGRVRRIKSNKFKILTVLLYNISNILGGWGDFR